MGISENIKLLRERHGLSQAELGKIAGVSDKAVSTWELGIKEPRMGAVQKIAAYFNLEKSNLIEDGGLDRDFSDGHLSSLAASHNDLSQSMDAFDFSILSDGYDYLKDTEGRLERIQPELFKNLSLKFDGDPRYIWFAYDAIQQGATKESVTLASLAASVSQNKDLRDLFNTLNHVGKEAVLAYMRFLVTQEQYTGK